jgi:hypothetical protein
MVFLRFLLALSVTFQTAKKQTVPNCQKTSRRDDLAVTSLNKGAPMMCLFMR